MKKTAIVVVLGVLILTVLHVRSFVSDVSWGVPEGDMPDITNISIFRNTPAWDLAVAVRRQRLNTIRRIVHENPSLLNYQDPFYGATLLLWAVGMERFDAAKALLELGADPNIGSTYDGETPLFVAAGFSWIDTRANKDTKMLNLLLRYNASPDIVFQGHNEPGVGNIIEPGASPLMESIGSGIDKTRALVEAGADINHKTETNITASIIALVTSWEPEYAHYLIVEKKARVDEAYFVRFGGSLGDELYPVDLLRSWVFRLDTKEYRLKMEIVEEFARQGVDYWETEISDFDLQRIKKLFPDTWAEYIQKY